MRLPLLALLAFMLAAPAAVLAAPKGNPDSEIVGGTMVKDDGKYPFMAAVDNLNYDSPYWCGGALIAAKYVMTAGHCVANESLDGYLPPEDFRVAIGYLDREAIPDSGWLPVKRVIAEPNYNPAAFYLGYDVALLELYEPVKGVEFSQLPESGSRAGERTGDPLTVIGWGVKYYLGPDSAQLREVTLSIDKAKSCKEQANQYLGSPYKTGLLICASAPGKSFCNGDSGGPLVAKDGDRWVQHGVVSGGVGCAMAGWAGFVTRLSNPSINEWIRTTAGMK